MDHSLWTNTLGKSLIKSVSISVGGGLYDWCDDCNAKKGETDVCENIIKTLDEKRLIEIYNEENDENIKDIAEINDYDFDYMTKDHDTYNRRKCGSTSFTYADKPGHILNAYSSEEESFWKEFAKPHGNGYSNMIGQI